MTTYEIKRNQEKNGTEIYFDGKPCEEVRQALKSNGFRWHSVKKCWYGRTDEKTAAAILNGENTEAKAESRTATRKAARLAPLWERCRVDTLPGYGTDNEIKRAVREEANRTGKGFDRCAAEYIRKHLRERFPECKFSVTSGGAGYLNSVDIYIKSAPWGKITVKGDPCAASWTRREDHEEPSEQLAAVLAYCEALHNVFDDDDGDIYADYGAYHDLYGSVAISGRFEQTEPTEEQRADAEAFTASKAADDARKEAEAAAKFEEEQRQREEERKQAEQREKETARAVKAIENHVEVIEIPEAEQKKIKVYSGVGKEPNIAEVRETIEEKKNEEAEPEQAKASRIVKFSDVALFEKFTEIFLHDFSFLAGKGGTATDDVRVTEENYQRLSREQRETVTFYMTDCVAVYLNDELKLIIDPEGYSYARYVAIPTGEEVTDDEQKQQEKGGEDFYIPAPAAEQIEAAEIKPGEQITMIYLEPWICSAMQYTGTLHSLKAERYAQYESVPHLIFTPEGRRTAREAWLTSEVLIYRGRLPEVPQELREEKISENMKRLKYSGNTAREYMRNVAKWYAAQGAERILDTVQR